MLRGFRYKPFPAPLPNHRHGQPKDYFKRLSTLDRIREIGYVLIRRPYENSALPAEVTKSNFCRKKVTVLYRSFVKAEELFDFGEKRTYNFIEFVERVERTRNMQ
jgi:hypothetical protein